MTPDTQATARFYALEQLERARRAILSLTDAMCVCRQAVAEEMPVSMDRARESYALLERTRQDLVAQCKTARHCLLELADTELSGAAGALGTQLAAFNLMTPDYEKLAGVLHAFAGRLPTPHTVNAGVIGRLMNNVRLGHYPTDLDNVAHITRAVAFPEGTVTNLIDPCCGDGSALRKLAMGNNCYAYGVELDQSRAEEAEAMLHRVGYGSFFYSHIQSGAFHLVFLNPPYLSVLNEKGGRSRDEKRFLIESIPLLIMGGLMVYIVPYYRLTEDICRIFSDHFTQVGLYRFTDREFKKFQQVALLGLRRDFHDGTDEADALSELACHPDELPCLSDIEEGIYPLPAVPKKVELFQGAKFNEAELARQLKASTSFKRLFVEQNKLDSTDKRPPLPLSIGQVGLIGGSGLINGLVEDECPHIIKGRIVKCKKTSSEDNFDKEGEYVSTEIKVTTSNKMIFTVLTRDGVRALA